MIKFILNEKTPIKLIKKIKPDVIIKGDDYKFSNFRFESYNIILFKKIDYLQQKLFQVKVIFLPLKNKIGTNLFTPFWSYNY